MAWSLGQFVGKPWGSLVLGCALLAWLAVERSRLDARVAGTSRANAEILAHDKLKAEISSLEKGASSWRSAASGTRSYLQSDLLLLRGLVVLEDTKREGLWIDSWSWNSICVDKVTGYELLVSGYTQAAHEAEADRSWDEWMAGLSQDDSRKVRLTPTTRPHWKPIPNSRSMSFQVRFRVAPLEEGKTPR